METDDLSHELGIAIVNATRAPNLVERRKWIGYAQSMTRGLANDANDAGDATANAWMFLAAHLDNEWTELRDREAVTR